MAERGIKEEISEVVKVYERTGDDRGKGQGWPWVDAVPKPHGPKKEAHALIRRARIVNVVKG